MNASHPKSVGIRALLPQRLKRWLKLALGVPLTRLHPDWEVLRLIGPLDRPHVLIDVGAHHGWFFHCWQDWCPLAEVHAFEPTVESFATMHALYGADPRVHLVPKGLSSRSGELPINVLMDSQVSNSFLPPKQDTWNSIAYSTGEVSRRTVPVTTLDEYFSEHRIEGAYLLKIDVQGYELEVLRGALRTLEKVDYIFVEAGIQRLYVGAPTFAEVFLFLEKHGFHLMHLRAWHRGNRKLVETDLIFRRNDLAPPIDNSRDRSYLELQ